MTRHYFLILRSKITVKQQQVRNFAEVRNFAWHRFHLWSVPVPTSRVWRNAHIREKQFCLKIQQRQSNVKWFQSLLLPSSGSINHGCNLVGETGDVSPLTFSNGGDIICHAPPTFFSLRFAFGEVSKIKVIFVTFCVKSFSC